VQGCIHKSRRLARASTGPPSSVRSGRSRGCRSPMACGSGGSSPGLCSTASGDHRVSSAVLRADPVVNVVRSSGVPSRGSGMAAARGMLDSSQTNKETK
jgi:hypothetical protein